MGFKTLAIQKQSSAVWEILGAVKTEFGKYGEVLDKVQKKLTEASDSITHIAIRKRAIDRKLKAVAEMPAGSAEALLELAAPDLGGSRRGIDGGQSSRRRSPAHKGLKKAVARASPPVWLVPRAGTPVPLSLPVRAGPISAASR